MAQVNPYAPKNKVDITGTAAASKAQAASGPIDITGTAAASKGSMGPPGSRPEWTQTDQFDQPDPRTAPSGIGPKDLWQGMRGKAIADYRGETFGYDPYQTSAGPQLTGMNYDPYRAAASNAAQSGAAQDFAGQQSALQLSGGMSSADRLKAFGNFNRQKILGQLGGVQQYDQAQSGNLVDIGRRNLQREATVNRTNIGAGNDASRDLAQANLRRDQNLYETGIAERDLKRQLEAAEIISASQSKGSKRSPLDNILNPLRVGDKTASDKLFNPLGL